ncbi:methyltransferase [Spiroplasma clarkii]|uniref:SAM-dependent methyltransferase n=1 Tax=Spiroplasma clarkii TaxID=2139 RepID=A0A1Y0L2F4_9MOLU|nr:class I SAM-dependent methyltransferase [Spiroplasma clarkii]ARU92186.1 methyltransferase [Spiroplasma clarkii]ATX71513.1 SAM-dependent methyltransferase [Spiroplasma clarkii]
MAKIIGHTFLAKLGKKRLRPGGIKATNWLLKQADFINKEILEVACNIGTTSFMLAKKYKCHITAIDRDKNAILKAQEKLRKTNLASKLTFSLGNALMLDFKDNQFDIILNEAMLTMLNDESKHLALQQYQRVLKNNGILLTHDICFLTDDLELQKLISAELSKAINLQVVPRTIAEWKQIFKKAGFHNLAIKSGRATLLNPIGMIKDEGLLNTLKIIIRAHKKENKQQFKAMYRVFKNYKAAIGFIAVVSQINKPD